VSPRDSLTSSTSLRRRPQGRRSEYELKSDYQINSVQSPQSWTRDDTANEEGDSAVRGRVIVITARDGTAGGRFVGLRHPRRDNAMRQITMMTRALPLLVNPGNAISRTTESPASRAMTYGAIVERGGGLIDRARPRVTVIT